MRCGRYRALVYLAWLGLCGRLRQIKRAFRTVRGVIAFLFGFLMFAGWIGLSLVGFLVRGRHEIPAREMMDELPFEHIQLYIALALLGYCLVTFLFRNRQAGVQFKPAEIDFLFPAPYHRRDLILFKICTLLCGVTLSAFIFACIFSWMPVPIGILFLGILLALSFAILINVLASMIALSVSARLYTRTIRAFAAAVLLAIAITAYLLLDNVEWSQAAQKSVAFAQSTPGRILLAPFMVYARAMTAQDWASFATYGGLAALVNLLTIGAILVVDADYFEASMETTRKVHERLKRIRQGDLFTAGAARATRSLPLPPRWGGVGPVAWRQATTAVRSLPRLLLVSLLLIAPGAAVMAIDEHRREIIEWVLQYLAAMLFLFMPAAFRFDFRSDLNKMSWLKGLPVPSWAVVTGQLMPATLMLLTAETLLLTIIALSADRWLYLAAIPLVPAAAFNMFAVDNFVFLLFPTRRFAMYPGDFQNLGYTYLVAIARFFVLGLVFGSAALLGAAMHFLLHLPIPVNSAITATFLTVIAAAWVPLLAWAYDRFDPSVDTPGE